MSSRRFVYKVWDAEENYLGIWNDVATMPDWLQYKDSAGSVYEIDLARIDNYGDGTDCAIGNRVEVYVYYGELEPLETENGTDITNHSSTVITVATGATNGLLVFSGTISRVVTDFDMGKVTASVNSLGLELSQFITQPPDVSYTSFQKINTHAALHFGNSAGNNQKEYATVWTANSTGYLTNAKGFYATATDPTFYLGKTIYCEVYHASDPTGANSGTLIGSSSLVVDRWDEIIRFPPYYQALTGWTAPYTEGWDFDNVLIQRGETYVMKWRVSTNSTNPLGVYFRLYMRAGPIMGYSEFHAWKYLNVDGWVQEPASPYTAWLAIPQLSITPTDDVTWTKTAAISDLIKELLDIAAMQGGQITYTSDSIETLPTQITISTSVDTVLTTLQSVMKATPPDWYWYVDLATGVFYFKQLHSYADIYLTLKGDIQSLGLIQTSEYMSNVVRLTGGEISENNPLYMAGQDNDSINQYGRRLKVLQDSNIKDATTGQYVIDNELLKGNAPTYQTRLAVTSEEWDIDAIRVGMTVGFNGFNNHVDDLILQITGYSYYGTSVVLELATRFYRVSSKIHDLEVEIQQLRNAKTTEVIT